MRPAPCAALPVAAVAAAVSCEEFSGQRALVIGGTRGLGEATAKAVAMGGGEVAITFHRGSSEARTRMPATAPYASSFKPQIAYFAAHRAEDQLEQLIAHIHLKHPQLPVILDAKRGDIGSTAEQYAREQRLPVVRLLDGASGGGSVKMAQEAGFTYVPVNPALGRCETASGLLAVAQGINDLADKNLVGRLRLVVVVELRL